MGAWVLEGGRWTWNECTHGIDIDVVSRNQKSKVKSQKSNACITNSTWCHLQPIQPPQKCYCHELHFCIGIHEESEDGGDVTSHRTTPMYCSSVSSRLISSQMGGRCGRCGLLSWYGVVVMRSHLIHVIDPCVVMRSHHSNSRTYQW